MTPRLARPLIVGLGLLYAGVSSAECDAPATETLLATTAWEARAAFEAMDQHTFVNQMDQLNQMIPCLNEPIDPMGAATIHLLKGLKLFGQKDLEGATLAFAAARSASSGFQMPESVAPAGHPLHAAFATIPIDNPEMRDVAFESGMTLLVDGKSASSRPAAWPAIVQLAGTDGATAMTAYLFPSDPIPAPANPGVAEPSTVSAEQATSAEPKGPNPAGTPVLSPSWRGPLIGVASTAVLTTAVLQLMASRSAKTYWDEKTGVSELNDLRSRTNSLNSASVATGVLSVGALATVSLTWEW